MNSNNHKYTVQDFEVFKSTICHEVKSKGNIDFLIDTLSSNIIEEKWELDRVEEALYLLSMVDYLSQKNGIPLCSKYSKYRCYKIDPPIFPLSMKLSGEDEEVPDDAIPEFLAHGIIEGRIDDVC